MRLSTEWAVGPALALALVAACSDRSPAESATAPGTRPVDAGGLHDAGPALQPDAFERLIVGRAGEALCGFDGDDRMRFDAHPMADGGALARDGERFALAYHDPERQLRVVLLGLEDPAVEAAPIPPRLSSQQVAIATIEGGFALAWRSAGDKAQLRTQLVRDDGVLLGTPATAPGDVHPEAPLSMLALDDHVHLAWLDAEGRIASATYPSHDPTALERVRSPDPGPVDQVVLSRLGGGLAHSWVSGGQVRLSRDGADPVILAEEARAPFAVTDGVLGGALTFSLDRPDTQLIRYRFFDMRGAHRLDALSIRPAPARFMDASIAGFAAGYVIVYRAPVSRDQTENAVRIAFMNRAGSVVYDGEISTTSYSGGVTDVVATDDGHVVLTWRDTDSGSVHLRRMDCAGAWDLCGGHGD